MTIAIEQLVKDVKLSAIRPLENYRKAVDKKKMDELTESVRTRGVIQPVLVRPVPDTAPAEDGIEYELVFGNRRYQASIAAARETIPAMVRMVSDEEALELQLIENNQKEDPNPMEEANGFKRLLDMGHHTTETLAARLDRSLDYVLGRLKLVRLPKPAQDKILSGEISIGHALQLTRLKNDGDIKKLLHTILDRGLSVRQTKGQLKDYFGTAMSDAQFDTAACANCESRTRNQAVLFQDAKKDTDLCLDQSCFFTRTRDHIKQAAKEYEAMGIRIITKENDARQLSSSNTTRRISFEASDYSGERPKKPAQCKKCVKRGFAFYEEKRYGGAPDIMVYWICLERKCLDKMNRTQGSISSGSGSTSQGPTRNGAMHSRAVRDRFLYSVMPQKLEASKTLQKRLAIHHLLAHFDELSGSVMTDKVMSSDEIREALLESFVPGRDVSEYGGYYPAEAFAIVAAIPEKDLDTAIARVIQASLRHTDSDVLFRMMPEAGVSMEKHFCVDEEYLKSLTKDGLIQFAKTLGIKQLVLDEAMKKTEMIEHVMKHPLTGKIPGEVAEECQFEDLDKLCPKKKEKKGPKK